MRVEIAARTIYIVDSRRNCKGSDLAFVDKLANICRTLVPDVWNVLSCQHSPKNGGRSESALLLCLNVAAFAFHRASEDDIASCFVKLFAYDTSESFLRKSRHYIADVAIRYMRDEKRIEAAQLIEFDQWVSIGKIYWPDW